MQSDRCAVGSEVLVHSKCGPHCLRKGGCRYRFPKEIVHDTHVAANGNIVPCRRHARVNGHNLLVANLARCNSDVKLTFLAPALLLSFIFYATKYMTKSDISVKRTLAIMEIATATAAQYQDNDTSDRNRVAKTLLRRCCARIGSDAEIPAPAVAYYILHGEDHFAGDKFVPVQLSVALGRLRRLERETDEADMHDDGDVKHVALQVDQDTNEIIEYNQVEDYVHRHPDLEDVSFYAFAARFEVKKGKTVASSTNAGRRFGFAPAHPRSRTHAAHEREVPAVPVLQGKSIPRRNHPSPHVQQRYARSVLALFKPWRALEDLRPQGSTWEDALAGFVPGADEANYIDNLQLLHAMKEEGDKRREAHESLGEHPTFERDGRNDRGSLEPEPAASTDVDADTVAAVLLSDTSDRDPWMVEALAGFSKFGLDDAVPRASAQSPRAPDAGITPWSLELATKAKAWDATLEARDSAIAERRQAMAAAPQEQERRRDAAQASTSSSGIENPRHLAETAPEPSSTTDAFDLDHPTNPIQFAAARGLNKKQTEAFCLIALAQLAVEDGDLTPRNIFISGPAGSGKSVALDAVAAWMAKRSRSGQLRLAASTGTAAANVRGMTLHSLLGYKHRKNAGADGEADALSSTKADFVVNDKVRAELAKVTLVCVDEVGMIGHRLLNAANGVFQKVKESSAPFGGIVTVWFGDFCQFVPVGDAALYNPPTQARLGGATTNLWTTEVTRCIVLDEPMRQRRDEAEFLSTLRDLRIGTNVEASWDLLNKRVAGLKEGAVRLNHSVYKNALFITPRHTLRREVNKRRVLTLARENSQVVLASIARYSTTGRKPKAVDLFELAGAAPRKHGNCDAVVYLTLGMPVVLTLNQHTGQGVTNGAYGTITKIVVNIKDELWVATAAPGTVVRLRRPPPLVIVKLRKVHADLARLDDLDEGEVPVAPVSGKTEFSGKRGNYEFEQLPLSPAFAVTDYQAQGATEPAVIIDLVPPGRKTKAALNASPLKNARAAAYVSISRVTTLEGLAVLRPFKTHDLGMGVEPNLRRQLERERENEARTRQELRGRIEELGWTEKLTDYVVRQKKYDRVF
ncbi:hypothetical protein JCM8097_000975 [Rhodosporidiobolus ruineniae]